MSDADDALAHAMAAHKAGRLEQAETGYRAILDATDDDLTALVNLATIRLHRGDMAEALALCDRAIAIDGNRAVIHQIRARALARTGATARASESYRRALALEPGNTAIAKALADHLKTAGDHRKAADLYRQIVDRDPNNVDAVKNLARCLESAGDRRAALAQWRRAVELAPNDVVARFSLGNALVDLRRLADGIAEFEMILAEDPKHLPSLINTANALARKGLMSQAITYYQRALDGHPDTAEVHNNLGNLYKDMGRAEDSIAEYRKAIALKPEFRPAHNNLLMAYNYLPDADPDLVFREHTRLGAMLAGGAEPPPAPAVDRDPDRVLRVGYLSPDFRTHPVAYFIEPVIAAHDRERVFVTGYHNSHKDEPVTARLAAAADRWHEVRKLDDAALEALIRADRIDILVDLAGYTAGNRLGVFARRPAPVQATYLGYPNTTGIPAIQYRLTDAWADPPDHDRLATERLIRLPHGFLCYRPPDDLPAVGPLPALRKGAVTFGSFNNLAKTHPVTIETWARILNAVPDSRLLFKSRFFADADMRAYFAKAFAGHGVDPARIEMAGGLPLVRDHLMRYNEVDIALDTFPYNGTTTTCEALAMGVPVITLAGHRHAGRVGVSLLSAYGLERFIADDRDSYIALARETARDLGALTDLRAGLRGRMRSAPCSDPKTFTGALEIAYRAMWRAFCETG